MKKSIDIFKIQPCGDGDNTENNREKNTYILYYINYIHIPTYTADILEASE